MAGAGCRIGVSPVGDAQLVLHVSRSHSKSQHDVSQPNSTSAPAPQEEAQEIEEFADCEEAVEGQSEGNRQKANATVSSTNGKSDSRSHASADSVAREMERALYDMVDLLQHSA
jgi:hypothetical protein